MTRKSPAALSSSACPPRRTRDWRSEAWGPPGWAHTPALFSSEGLATDVLGNLFKRRELRRLTAGWRGDTALCCLDSLSEALPAAPGFPDPGIAFTVFRWRVRGVGGQWTRLSVCHWDEALGEAEVTRRLVSGQGAIAYYTTTIQLLFDVGKTSPVACSNSRRELRSPS